MAQGLTHTDRRDRRFFFSKIGCKQFGCVLFGRRASLALVAAASALEGGKVCSVFMQIELNCWKTQVRLLEYICKIMRKNAISAKWHFPCLGPAAVVAVNSVEVEVSSSGVPVSGGEFG